MNTFDFLAHLRNHDIQVSAENGKLRVSAPEGAVTPEIKSELWERKGELISLLSENEPLLIEPHEAPLSLPQEHLWQLHRLTPHTVAYNMYSAFRLHGQLDVYTLETALRAVAERHEILRTSFPQSDQGVPEQSVAPVSSVNLRQMTLSASPNTQEIIESILEEEIRKPFDLQASPLFRPTLVSLSPREHVLILVIHHLVFDGQSFHLFYDDLEHAYRAKSEGKSLDWAPLPLSYIDYAAWQRQWLASEASTPARDYWRTLLAGDVPALELPFDHPHPLHTEADGDTVELRIPPELSAALHNLIRQEGVTLFSAVLTAFYVLLHRRSGQGDLLVCSPVAARDRTEFDRLIGYFNNTLLLRADLSTVHTLRELLHQTHSLVMSALPHQTFPFREVAGFPNVARTPLSRAMVVVQNSSAHEFRLPGIDIEELPAFNRAVQYDLSLEMLVSADQMVGQLMYRRVLFEPATVQSLADELMTVLEELAGNADTKIDRKVSEKETRDGPSEMTVRSPYTAPRTELERRLAQIWQEVLGIERPGIHDGFYELGGHSLLALRLFTRIEQDTGTNLPLSTLFEARTIAQLAGMIAQHSNDAQWSSLVPIQPQGERPPLFCVHGLTGDVLWFHRLGELLAPDQPFYGIQARGLDALSEPFDDIAAMAAFYIDEIKDVQPSGPYSLSGASLGGTVALEMAHQLHARGDEVNLLIMFDHAPDAVLDRRSRITRWASAGRHMLSNAPHWVNATRHLDSEQLAQRVRRKARAGWKQLVDLLGKAQNHQTSSAYLLDYGDELPGFRQRMIEAHYRAITQYRARSFAGPVLLLQAAAQPLLSVSRPESTWRNLANGALTVITVPGSHETIFKEPQVERVAQELRAELERVQAIRPGR